MEPASNLPHRFLHVLRRVDTDVGSLSVIQYLVQLVKPCLSMQLDRLL